MESCWVVVQARQPRDRGDSRQMRRLIAETDTVVHDGPDAQRLGTCRIVLYLGVVSVVENEMVAVASPGAKRAFWEGFVTFSLAGLAGFTRQRRRVA
jgi:hypothetical protein